jgi:ATP-binding cassette subfamily C protein LapB
MFFAGSHCTFTKAKKLQYSEKIGSGKTTLLKLMIGFYTPSSGSVLINGVDSRQLDPVDLRRNIGYIAQDDILFNGTVRQNIMMSAPWANEKTFLEACQLAGVDQFISESPEGYDMMVGERGAFLSGGQRQSISAARAFLNRPRFTIV